MSEDVLKSNEALLAPVTTISSLYAQCGSDSFEVTFVRASLELGAGAQCTIKVIRKREEKTSPVTIVDSLHKLDISDKFKTGVKVLVYQKTTSSTAAVAVGRPGSTTSSAPDVLLFCGYVISSELRVNSSPGAYGYEYTVDLRSADALYSGLSTQVGAVYLDATQAANAKFRDLGTVLARSEQVKKITESFNSPAKFAATVIDATAEDRRNTESRSKDAYDLLADFIDIENAPKLNSELGLNGNLAVNNPNFYDAVRLSKRAILEDLQRSSGLSVLAAYVAKFGMILAPRVRESRPFDVILNIGICKKTPTELGQDQIVGFIDTSPIRVFGRYQAFAVQTAGQGNDPSSAQQAILWRGGYDKDGKPELKPVTLTLSESRNKNIPTIANTGPIIVVPLPAWLTKKIPMKDMTSAAAEEVRKKYANALAKTYFAANLGSPGTLAVDVLYSSLTDFYNQIGAQHKITVPTVGGGKTTVHRYGRLIKVTYTVEADGPEFSAKCTLGFDHVCSEDEYNAFGIDEQHLLCVPETPKDPQSN